MWLPVYAVHGRCGCCQVFPIDKEAQARLRELRAANGGGEGEGGDEDPGASGATFGHIGGPVKPAAPLDSRLVTAIDFERWVQCAGRLTPA